LAHFSNILGSIFYKKCKVSFILIESTDHILGMPKFGEDLNNVTVPVGREAIFICNVEGLATYKVTKSTYFS